MYHLVIKRSIKRRDKTDKAGALPTKINVYVNDKGIQAFHISWEKKIESCASKVIVASKYFNGCFVFVVTFHVFFSRKFFLDWFNWLIWLIILSRTSDIQTYFYFEAKSHKGDSSIILSVKVNILPEAVGITNVTAIYLTQPKEQ